MIQKIPYLNFEKKNSDINLINLTYSIMNTFLPKIFALIITASMVLFLNQNFANGQEIIKADSTITSRIETIDGNIFTGIIQEENTEILILSTEQFGNVRIRKAEIRNRTTIEATRNEKGQIWLPNPQSTRYFWAPNGYGLQKGESYYQNIWVLYNQMSFGITDRFSFGVGTLPLFLFSGTATPVWIIPKFSIPIKKDKWNIGTGALIGTVLGETSTSYGLIYGTTTFGSRDMNVSLGIASGFVDGSWTDKPVINFSTLIRISQRGYFISENYILPEGDSSMLLLSFGGRTIIRNVGLDFSLVIPAGVDTGGLIAAPFLGITVPIHKTKK